VNKGAWGIAKEKVDVQVSVERVQNFEEAFLKIKAATGITDIEELVRTFIKNEDQNFSLFNYVNEQTNEIEKTEELIQQLLEEEHKFAQESGEDAERQKQVLQSLEAKLEATKDGVRRFENKCVKTHKTIGSLKKGIGHMFTRVECNPGAMMFSSSSDGGDFATAVTEPNILQYMGLIEQRCNDVLQQYAACQQKERARLFANKGDDADAVDDEEGGDEVGVMSGTQAALSVLGAGPTTPMGQDLIHVNPPKLDDYSSEEEDEDEEEADLRPLTRDELKAKALNRMNRRGGSQPGGKKGRK
jgi:hypothetical protein